MTGSILGRTGHGEEGKQVDMCEDCGGGRGTHERERGGGGQNERQRRAVLKARRTVYTEKRERGN